MSTVTLMENQHVKLWFHVEDKIIHHEIHGLPPSDVFRSMLSEGAKCLEENKAQKWLSDDRSSAVVRKEDANWGDTVWAPRVIIAGFKYWAIVLPNSAIAKIQMQRFCKEYKERGVTVELFDMVDAAMRWLKKTGTSSSHP